MQTQHLNKKFKDGTAVFTRGGEIYLLINNIIHVEELDSSGAFVKWLSTNININAIYDANYNLVYTKSEKYNDRQIMKIVRSIHEEHNVIYQREEK